MPTEKAQKEMKGYLVRAFRRLLGNKGYMDDLETLLKDVTLSPKNYQTIQYLIADLNNLDIEKNRLERKSKYFF